MNENKIVRLQVLDKVTEAPVEEKTVKTFNASNPIYKNVLNFHHAKIGEKLTISDILR